MPPEQLPWDRRDFRKHDRSGSDRRFTGGGGGRGVFGGGDHRWREQHHHPHAPPHPPPYHNHRNNPQQRWYSDFRSSRPIPPGHGKQSGWGMHHDEAGRGFLPFGSRYSDRNPEDDSFRPFGSRGEGRYFRNSRENRGSFGQKDWKSPSWEPPVASFFGSGKPNNEVGNQKSVDNAQTCPSNSSKGNNSEIAETCQNNSSKGNNTENTHNNGSKGNNSPLPPPDSLLDQPQAVTKEKNEGTGEEPVSSVQKSDKGNAVGSMDWKLKWNRSDSLPLRGSGLGRSSSSKSNGVHSVEKLAEVQLKNTTPVDSPAAVSVDPTAGAPSEDTSSRKKPRLGWGEGLAKYEKKKVEGPEDGVMKDVIVNSVSTTETMECTSVDMLDKSPKAADLLDCASPATPSSVGCSSSPGIEEKESMKAVNIDHNPANLSFRPNIMSHIHCDEPIFNLENLELASIANLSSSINGMLQPDDPTSVETGYVRATSMNKLLVWKVNVLKALEVTESEIDLLETELKSLVAVPRSPSPAVSNLLPVEGHSDSYEQVTVSSFVRSAPLQVVASGDMIVESPPADDEDSMSDEDEDEDDTACLDDDKCNVAYCQDLSSLGTMNFNCDHTYEAALASNKDIANRVLEELNKLLPGQQHSFDVLAASTISSLQRDSSVVKDRLLMRKRSLLFKEKVLTLKFKAFHHFWREGRVVSVNKLLGKSLKKLNLCRTGYKKNRSSSRSRISDFAGSSRKVPAEEVIEFINGLLRESQMKPCRSTLKMPAMILDKGIKTSRFVSDNALVLDPCAAERERSMINPWTPGETEIFIDKLSMFGKNFSKIACFLEHKTVADCIEFYYKNHKSESFQRAKPGIAKQSKSQSTIYLVANGKRWNREANAASLDVLGEASMIAANVIETQQQECASSKILPGASSSQIAPPRILHGPLERSVSLDNNDAAAADVLAGICGSLSSVEAMRSCTASSVDPAERYPRRVTCVKWPLTPDVSQSLEDECSDDSGGEMMNPTDWTDEEKSFFVQAVSSYGKDFAMISECLRTRSVEQCKTFFSKARKRLGLDRVTVGPRNTAVCGGRSSDMEDACVVQTGSFIAVDDSARKLEVDLPEKCGNESDMPGTSESEPNYKAFGESSQLCSLNSIVAEPVMEGSSKADDTLVYDKHVVDFNVDNREQICVVGAFTPELDVKSSVETTAIVESVIAGEGSNLGQSNGGSSEPDSKDLFEASDGDHVEDNGRGFIVCDGNMENKKVADGGANSTEMSVSWTPVEVKVENVSQADLLPSFQKDSGSQNLLLEQNGHFASLESASLYSVPVKYQRHSGTDSLPDVRANRGSQNYPQNVALAGDSQQHISRYSLLDSVEPSHILRGYPVSVQTLKEINGDVVRNGPTQNVPKRDDKLNLELHADFSLRKCSTGLRNEMENAPSPPPLLYNSKSQSGCLPDMDKPQPLRNGDVKLFGKILKSSQEQTSSCECDVSSNNNNSPHHQKAGHNSQSLTLKFSGDDTAVNLDSFQSKVDSNSYLPSEKNNIPYKGFGCWDENQTTHPTIFPSLPDSAVLLAKYPAAFSNHSMSTLQIDQNNDHRPFFPTRDMNNGLTDYQLLRKRELQSFTVDNMKQPPDLLFPEMQRRNGFSVVQGMQQQSTRPVVGIDVGRGGGVLVGGQCSGVSDPVTAIKLHYAKAQGIAVQAGNVSREDDTWRSNGDVGR